MNLFWINEVESMQEVQKMQYLQDFVALIYCNVC
jgi:hypothetical protein